MGVFLSLDQDSHPGNQSPAFSNLTVVVRDHHPYDCSFYCAPTVAPKQAPLADIGVLWVDQYSDPLFSDFVGRTIYRFGGRSNLEQLNTPFCHAYRPLLSGR